MFVADGGALDEALARLHRTGPEFRGWLSNHGSMVVESMVRHGFAPRAQPWLDDYVHRLEDLPRSSASIDGARWQQALGKPAQLPQWLEFFRIEMTRRPWRQTLATWWPRLLPGAAAGATHGVIRTGHAVRALLEDGDSETRLAELGQALGYWAARWQQVPGAVEPAGVLAAAEALERVPAIGDPSGGILHRLEQLPGTPGWSSALAGLRPAGSPQEARELLERVADAATIRYLRFGHGEGVMQVHAATAPTAVLRTLPALPPEQWAASLNVAWAASAAIRAVYQPDEPAPTSETRRLLRQAEAAGPQEVLARAVRHGDAHVIKLADTAVEVHQRTGDPEALAAVLRATELVDPD